MIELRCLIIAAQGIAECERALALDRNLATARVFIGLAKYALGRAEETEAHILEALRISPRDILACQWMMIAGFAKLLLNSDYLGRRERVGYARLSTRGFEPERDDDLEGAAALD